MAASGRRLFEQRYTWQAAWRFSASTDFPAVSKVPVPITVILRIRMRISVDANALGRHLTGNEVYFRSLMREFAILDPESEFVAYISEPGSDQLLPRRFKTRHVAADPYFRLGWDLSRRLAEDKPDLVHLQYTAPLINRTARCRHGARRELY